MRSMRKIQFWIAVLAMLLCSTAMAVAADDDAMTYELADCGEQVKLVGRTVVTEDGIVPHTTASGIAFYTDAVGDVEMTISGGDGYVKMFDHEYFIVYLDGVEHTRLELKFMAGTAGKDTFTIAEDLDGEMHRIEVLRETEEINAVALFESITMDGDMIPALEAPMMIEFVGDSITTGYGAYPFSAESATLAVDDPIRQAGTRSYAYLTAQQLGADIQVCCTSGYGVLCGYNSDGANLQGMYPYTAYHNDHSSDEALWSFDRAADVVVINLGTNDKGTYRSRLYNDNDMHEAIKNMMELAREKNPDAKVVWVTGMMGITFKPIITDVVDELGGADEGYYFCELPRGTSGGAGHPDQAEHEAAAAVLTAFLKSDVIDEEYFDNQVTVEEMEDLIGIAGSLPGCDGDIARAELAAAENTDFDAYGTMTVAYETLKSQAITVAVIAGAILVVVAAALVIFAVLYKPKKKEAPVSDDASDEDKGEDKL